MAATFEIYRDKRGEWRWRLRHQNGNIIAVSGEGYVNRLDAYSAVASVRRAAVKAKQVEVGEE